jgi:1,4-alpha-glucan branching enzyme
MDCSDWEQSIVTFCRFSRNQERLLLCACNFTPVARRGYRVGVPRPGFYREAINSDASVYGGGDVGNAGGVASEPVPWHGQPHSVMLTLPPLAALWLIPA